MKVNYTFCTKLPWAKILETVSQKKRVKRSKDEVNANFLFDKMFLENYILCTKTNKLKQD